MSVTLEVSQLRGWLKASAPCRGSQAVHTVRGELRGPGGGRAVCTQRAGERRETADWGLGAGAAHGKHVAHVRNAGRVPAQGLVEGARVLPRVASRAHGAGRAARAARLARSGQGRGLRLQRSGAKRAGSTAHAKHVDHVRDAGGVPAQGLVEGVRGLPRVARRAHGAGRAAGREAGGERLGCASSVQGGRGHVTASRWTEGARGCSAQET